MLASYRSASHTTTAKRDLGTISAATKLDADTTPGASVMPLLADAARTVAGHSLSFRSG
jgi:hypothetical protein